MKINYCLPIIKNKKAEVLSLINENINEFNFFEIWLDYIEDWDEQFLRDLIEQFEGKLIFLFRRKNLEKINMSFEKRKFILSIIDNKLSHIDLDVFTQKEEIEYIEKNNLKLKKIISYHNYQETPTFEQLMEIIATIGTCSPEIFKFSTMCNSEEDALKLLKLQLHLKTKNIKHIVSGMGELGKITKVFGTLWGNEMVFCPVNIDGQSAPGQLTKNELESIFKILNT